MAALLRAVFDDRVSTVSGHPLPHGQPGRRTAAGTGAPSTTASSSAGPSPGSIRLPPADNGNRRHRRPPATVARGRLRCSGMWSRLISTRSALCGSSRTAGRTTTPWPSPAPAASRSTSTDTSVPLSIPARSAPPAPPRDRLLPMAVIRRMIPTPVYRRRHRRALLDEPGPSDFSGMTYEAWRRHDLECAGLRPRVERRRARRRRRRRDTSFLYTDRETGRALNAARA